MDDRIGAMLDVAMHVYIDSSRQTGRTTRMLSEMQESDVVVCASTPVARNIEHLARSTMGKRIKCVVVEPRNLHDCFYKLRGVAGKVHFDHTWIEQFYREEIKHISSKLLGLQNALNERNHSVVPPASYIGDDK